MTRKKHQFRLRRLIRPHLQLRLTGWFLCLGLLGLFLQFLVLQAEMSSVTLAFGDDPVQNEALLGRALLKTLLISLGVVAPLTLAAGILNTFRIAGPLSRLETYLGQVCRGEKPADCRLRKGDELHELCQLINEATAPLRAAGGGAQGEEHSVPEGGEGSAEQAA